MSVMKVVRGLSRWVVLVVGVLLWQLWAVQRPQPVLPAAVDDR